MVFLLLVLFLFVLGVLILFMVQNLLPVSIMFFGVSLLHVPLGLVVLCSFLAGALLLYILSLFRTVRHRLIISGKIKDVKTRERTIDDLRAQVVKLENELRLAREQQIMPALAPVTDPGLPRPTR